MKSLKTRNDLVLAMICRAAMLIALAALACPAAAFTPKPKCQITGPTTVCPGTTNQYCVIADTGTNHWSVRGCDAKTVGSTSGTCVMVKACSTCGSFTVKWINGSEICTLNVDVVDDIKPEIWCPPDKYLQCGESTAPGTCGTATATDNCPCPVTITYVDKPKPANCTGKQGLERTWKATDCCGNYKTCVQKIEYKDTTPPVIVRCAPDMQVQCGGTIPPCNPGAVTATDNCGGPVTVTCALQGSTSGTGCSGGGATYVYTAKDGCGNTATCTQHITFNDTQPPVINCQPSKHVPCYQGATFDTPTATDNCDPNPVITIVSTTSGSGPCPQSVGSMTRTWKATDKCGNSSTCSQTITFIDNQAPLIVCQNELNVACASEIPVPCTNVDEFTFCCGSVLDVCDPCVVLSWKGDAVFTAAGMPSIPGYPGLDPCNYYIMRTYRATDRSGNWAECQQRINVKDDVGPVISGVYDIVSCIGASVNLPDPSVIDNCTPNVTANCSRSDGKPCSDPFPSGITVVTWSAQDACGNPSSVSIEVDVQDCPKVCSQTVSTWGNKSGAGDTSISKLLSRAMGGNIVVGRSNGSSPASLKIKASAADCLINLLPSGTKVEKLPPNLGNVVLTRSACERNNFPIALTGHGRIRNNLLGQTITLSLNMRYDKLKGEGMLGKVKLSEEMTTIDENGEASTWNLSPSVLRVLPHRTVKDLLNLANNALAGRKNGKVNLKRLNSTINKVNAMFDGCTYVPVEGSGGSALAAGGGGADTSSLFDDDNDDADRDFDDADEKNADPDFNTGNANGNPSLDPTLPGPLDPSNPSNPVVPSNPSNPSSPVATPSTHHTHHRDGDSARTRRANAKPRTLTDGMNDDLLNIARYGGNLRIKGDYTQMEDATLFVELRSTKQTGGMTSDTLRVDGEAQLSGNLVVRLRKNFHPQPGEKFRIITARNIQGTFDHVDLASMPNPQLLDVVYGRDAVTIVVKAHPDMIGDLNNDGRVNAQDLNILTSQWHKTNSSADLNHDGTVNAADMAILLGNWGTSY